MPDTTVRYYDVTMSGAPALSGTAGTLIGILDACLVTGFGSVTLDSLVVAANVATGTVSTGHNFAMISATGPVIRIEGATPAGLNGDWRVTVTSATQFTFATSGISDQTASGTITAKRAPAGFSKTYSGTNKAVYRADHVQSTRLYLRVDDSPAQYPTLTMYETMSDVDTGTGASTVRYFAKSITDDGTARAWTLFADDRLFYLFANADSSPWPSVMAFGDIDSYRSGDAYHCLLIGHAAANTTSHLLFVDGTTTGAQLARSYSQTGAAVSSSRYSHRKCQYIGGGGMAVPNNVNNAVHFWPVECWESTAWARGLMPGLYCPLHDASIAQGSVFTVGDRTFAIQKTYNNDYEAALDLTGPWR